MAAQADTIRVQSFRHAPRRVRHGHPPQPRPRDPPQPLSFASRGRATGFTAATGLIAASASTSAPAAAAGDVAAHRVRAAIAHDFVHAQHAIVVR